MKKFSVQSTILLILISNITLMDNPMAQYEIYEWVRIGLTFQIL